MSGNHGGERNHNPIWKVTGGKAQARPVSDGHFPVVCAEDGAHHVGDLAERRVGANGGKDRTHDVRLSPAGGLDLAQGGADRRPVPPLPERREAFALFLFDAGIDLEEVVGLPFLHDEIVLPDDEGLIICRRLREGSALRYV